MIIKLFSMIIKLISTIKSFISRIQKILNPPPKKPLPEHNNYKGVEFENEVLIFTEIQGLEECSFHNCVLIFSEEALINMRHVFITHSIISGDLVASHWYNVVLAGVILNDVRVSHARWVGAYFVTSKGRLTLTSTDQAHTSFLDSPDLEVYAKNLSFDHTGRSPWKPLRDSTLKELSIEDIRELTRDLVGLDSMLSEAKNRPLRPLGVLAAELENE